MTSRGQVNLCRVLIGDVATEDTEDQMFPHCLANHVKPELVADFASPTIFLQEIYTIKDSLSISVNLFS